MHYMYNETERMKYYGLLLVRILRKDWKDKYTELLCLLNGKTVDPNVKFLSLCGHCGRPEKDSRDGVCACGKKKFVRVDLHQHPEAAA